MSQHWKLPRPRLTLTLKKDQKPLPVELVPFMVAAAYYDWKHVTLEGKKQRVPTMYRVERGSRITVEDLRRLRQWCEDRGFVIPADVRKTTSRKSAIDPKNQLI